MRRKVLGCAVPKRILDSSFPMNQKRIGILTSGGDCPGLNAVIRGASKTCWRIGLRLRRLSQRLRGPGRSGAVHHAHASEHDRHSQPGRHDPRLDEQGPLRRHGRRPRPAGTRTRVARRRQDDCRATWPRGLICIGGDGSLAIAQQFHEFGIPVVGVPKTIDNDLSATAFTFGFDSAVACATDALDRLHTTAASHERVLVLEVMGRHAGWIALHAGIAGGGDVILIPEIPWTFENVCHKILDREHHGKKFTLIVVAEGAELPDGGIVGDSSAPAPRPSSAASARSWLAKSNDGYCAKPASSCSATCNAAARRRRSTACWPRSTARMPCG